MKKFIGALLALLVGVPPAWANCDLTHFRWGCDLPAKTHVKPYVSRLVYCRNTPLYLSQESYDQVIRYQRANVSMNLMLNGEFIEGPCVPGSN